LQLWAEVQVSELKEKALAQSEDQHRKYVTQVQNRAQAGHSPRSDVQLSLTRLAAVQAELEQARAQKRQAISRLEQMYGSPMPTASIAWTASLQNTAAASTQPTRTAQDWLAQVEDKHPSLQKAAAPCGPMWNWLSPGSMCGEIIDDISKTTGKSTLE
jgi:outer membrane protein TolC